MNQTTSWCLHCSCQLQDDEGSERLPHAASRRHSLVVPCRLGFFFPPGCMGLLEQTNQLWLSVNKSLVAVPVKRHPSGGLAGSGMDGPLTARTVPRQPHHHLSPQRNSLLPLPTTTVSQSLTQQCLSWLHPFPLGFGDLGKLGNHLPSLQRLL
jgi:hypothetical protein